MYVLTVFKSESLPQLPECFSHLEDLRQMTKATASQRVRASHFTQDSMCQFLTKGQKTRGCHGISGTKLVPAEAGHPLLPSPLFTHLSLVLLNASLAWSGTESHTRQVRHLPTAFLLYAVIFCTGTDIRRHFLPMSAASAEQHSIVLRNASLL